MQLFLQWAIDVVDVMGTRILLNVEALLQPNTFWF